MSVPQVPGAPGAATGPFPRTIGGLPGGRVRRRAGALFVWFMTVGLLIMSFGFFLAMDATRMIVAARQMSNATEAAAVAGAQQFQQGRFALDTARADTAAKASIRKAVDERSVLSNVHGDAHVTVSPIPGYSGQRVRVSVDYSIDGLVMMPVVHYLTGSGKSENSVTYTMVREADVCLPGQYTPTGGSCVRPTTR